MKEKPQIKRKKPSLSHDRFFKLFYSNPELARELFQFIFSEEELKAYDLTKLKIEKNSFEGKEADLVFSLPLKAFPKMKVEIFILLEHKSSYDKNFFGQVLTYQVLIREHSIQQRGYPQPIIPLLFYHGEKPLKWKKSLQEEDFKPFFSKIPAQSRKNMLNYEPKVINTKDLKVRKAFEGKKWKGRGVIKLLSEIWNLKKKPTPLKIRDVYAEFGGMLKGLKGEARRTVELRILEYLKDNTELDSKTWEKAEKLLIEAGVLKQGGLMQDVREIIKEKGRWEGEKQGLKKGRQEIVLKMLKKKADIAFISEVTGLSEKEIKKLKNGS